MRIVFDAITLHQSQRGSITGVVCFDFGERRQFPEADWNDFVVVIAGWWITAMEQLGRGRAKVELRFMDGPYWITAVTQGPNVQLQCVEDRAGGEHCTR